MSSSLAWSLWYPSGKSIGLSCCPLQRGGSTSVSLQTPACLSLGCVLLCQCVSSGLFECSLVHGLWQEPVGADLLTAEITPVQESLSGLENQASSTHGKTLPLGIHSLYTCSWTWILSPKCYLLFSMGRREATAHWRSCWRSSSLVHLLRGDSIPVPEKQISCCQRDVEAVKLGVRHFLCYL